MLFCPLIHFMTWCLIWHLEIFFTLFYFNFVMKFMKKVRTPGQRCLDFSFRFCKALCISKREELKQPVVLATNTHTDATDRFICCFVESPFIEWVWVHLKVPKCTRVYCNERKWWEYYEFSVHVNGYWFLCRPLSGDEASKKVKLNLPQPQIILNKCPVILCHRRE